MSVSESVSELSPLAVALDLLPEGYTVRPATLDDCGAAAEVVNACAVALTGHAETEASEVANDWQVDAFDLASNTVCVIAPDGTLAAFSEYWSLVEPKVRPYVFVRVHPAHQGRGLGTALLRIARQRAERDLAAAPPGVRVVLRTSVTTQDQAALRLFENEGYVYSRTFLRMVIDLDGPPPAPQWPEGITLRVLPPNPSLEELHRIFDADVEAFQDHWGFLPIAFETWINLVIEKDPNFDPTLWFLAMDGDEIAGFSLCRSHLTEDPAMGWVGSLGVRRPWRRRGLAQALLLHSFGEFGRRGQQRVGLGVDADSLTGATRLYERVGMRRNRQLAQYDLVLRDGEELSTQALD